MNFAAARDSWNTVLGFFYPEICQLCRAEPASSAGGYVCAPCRAQVRPVRPPYCQRCGLPYAGDLTGEFECSNCLGLELHFRSARSAVVAGKLMLDVIHRFKYQRHLWFEPFLAGLLVAEATPVLRGQGWDCIVPVPLHPLKEREREFNQAALLARHLGRATDIPLNESLLRRVSSTETQTHLNREKRAANMKNAFAVRPEVRPVGWKVVLVDDVFTTGATTNACAQALKAAGAGEVCVWTVARGL
jgi:ComF family protein